MRRRTHHPLPQQSSYGCSGLALGCGLVIASLLLFCTVGMFIGGSLARGGRQEELAEANRLWDAGQKSEAVTKYKTLIERDLSGVPSKAERPAVFQRAIDYELELGHTDEARALVEKALDKNVDITSGSPATTKLVAQVLADRERRAAEERARKEAEDKRKQEEREANAKRSEEEQAAEAKRKEEERIAEAKRKEDERKRRTEAWRFELEEKAFDLALIGNALEERLKDREAVYKRRTEAGNLDYSTKQEIEKLKKQIPHVWEEVAKIDDTLAAGPPESLFVDKTPTSAASSTPATEFRCKCDASGG